jgi:hypothetical protein
MVGWELLLPARPATHAPAPQRAVRAGEQLQAGNLATVLEAIAAAPHVALAIRFGLQDLRQARTATHNGTPLQIHKNTHNYTRPYSC